MAPAVTAAVVGAVVSAALTTIATVVLTPDEPAIPTPLDDEAKLLGNAADQEAARRRAANPQQSNPVGAPGVGGAQVNVGAPTVVLGG